MGFEVGVQDLGFRFEVSPPPPSPPRAPQFASRAPPPSVGSQIRFAGLGCRFQPVWVIFVSSVGFNMGVGMSVVGPRVSGVGSRVSGVGSRVSGVGSRVLGVGSKISGVGSRE